MSHTSDVPRVSVLLPMRNAAPFVESALRSILCEKQVSLEVVVVDDGSTDASAAVVRAVGDARIRMIDGPCIGIAAAFNAALFASRGEIVMRCDADDLYPPGRIHRQVQWLEEHPDFGAICGAFAAMDSTGKRQIPFRMSARSEEITLDLQGGKTGTHLCSFAVKATIVKSIGGARSFFITGEDIDLQLRLGEVCRVWYAPEIAYVYRIHGGSITHTVRSQSRDFYEDMARHFQRQRLAQQNDDLQLGLEPKWIPNDDARVGSASQHMQTLLIGSSWAAFNEGKFSSALRHAHDGALQKPGSFAGWRNLFVLTYKIVRRAAPGSAKR